MHRNLSGLVLRLENCLFVVFIFRQKNETLEESDDLPNPDVIAPEIVEDLEALGIYYQRFYAG
jgi:hypothetical protein